MEFGSRGAVEAIRGEHDLPPESPAVAPCHDDEPGVAEPVFAVAMRRVGEAGKKIQAVGAIAATNPFRRGEVKVEVDGVHEIVRQAQDEATHHGRQPPLIHVSAENAEREVGIAPNGDHNEPDATVRSRGLVSEGASRNARKAVVDMGLSQVA